MTPSQTKRFAGVFLPLFLIWLIIANLVPMFAGYEFVAVLLLGNACLFLMPGEDLMRKTRDVAVGGTVGIIGAWVMLTLIALLTDAFSALGDVGHALAFIIAFIPIVGGLIAGQAWNSMVFNNVGFAYLIMTTMPMVNLHDNFWHIFIGFVVGCTIINLVSVAIFRFAEKTALAKP